MTLGAWCAVALWGWVAVVPSSAAIIAAEKDWEYDVVGSSAFAASDDKAEPGVREAQPAMRERGWSAEDDKEFLAVVEESKNALKGQGPCGEVDDDEDFEGAVKKAKGAHGNCSEGGVKLIDEPLVEAAAEIEGAEVDYKQEEASAPGFAKRLADEEHTQRTGRGGCEDEQVAVVKKELDQLERDQAVPVAQDPARAAPNIVL